MILKNTNLGETRMKILRECFMAVLPIFFAVTAHSAQAQSNPSSSGEDTLTTQSAATAADEVDRSTASNSTDAPVNSTELEQLKRRVEELEQAQTANKDATRSNSTDAPLNSSELEQLKRRVKELEQAQIANEDATRSIIRDAVSTLGSRINEFVGLSGTFEFLGGSAETFQGPSERVLEIATAQLDFDIQVNDWTVGYFRIEYDAASSVLFPTTEGTEASVDRINLDTAYITVGDPQRFPPYLTVGRQVVPFGISTGDPVADVPTLDDPLTIQVFETREDAVLLGLGFPTPPLIPKTPAVSPPPVKPLVVNPLVKILARSLGYRPPPTRPPAPTFTLPPPQPPPFNAGVYLYNGDTGTGGKKLTGEIKPSENIGGTLGYRTQGSCGRSYEQLATGSGSWLHWLCPWGLDVDVDYNSSVFDSLFLGSVYKPFLNQIGTVPGIAASLKTNLGPVALVGEWNGAIKNATFTVPQVSTRVSMRPSAWQVSLAYQFDWNPWVDAIAAQGTYFAIGYSESQDLAGVTQVISGVNTRIGNVPEKRFLVSVGEWVLDGLRVALEYSLVWDYPRNAGGTGKSANGLFAMLTYEW